MRNGRDGGERFAAEAERADGGQIGSGAGLLVAWRRKAVGSSSGAMPQPSSVTRR